MKSKKQIKIEAARELRKRATFAEDWLWQKLRDRKLIGAKFRRQYVLRGFVLDFYCPDHKIGIELDGAIHEITKDYDAARDKLVSDLGTKIIRLKNREVLDKTNEVIKKIADNLMLNNTEQKVRKNVLPLHEYGEGDRG